MCGATLTLMNNDCTVDTCGSETPASGASPCACSDADCSSCALTNGYLCLLYTSDAADE